MEGMISRVKAHIIKNAVRKEPKGVTFQISVNSDYDRNYVYEIIKNLRSSGLHVDIEWPKATEVKLVAKMVNAAV